MRNVLVTGGAGFIGSHLSEALTDRGDSVIVIDNLSTGKNTFNSSVEFIEGSIFDLPLMDKLISQSDYVLHLAAAVGVFNIVNNPLASLLTNIRGTENVLEAAHSAKTPVFLTSSSEVYGKNVSNSLKESDDRILGSPVTLRWSYSEAKAIDESLAYAYFVENGLETRIVRFFNTVGPRQSGKYGMVIPRFVRAAIDNKPLQIFGDGSQTRVFCHVSDSVKAILALSVNDKTIGEVFNIGGKGEISILELAKLIIKQTNSKSEITFTDYEDAYATGFEEMARRVPDISKLTKFTGWEPELGLDTIIDDVSKSYH